MTGALKPTDGKTTVLGLDPVKNKWNLRHQIGYMPQNDALYDDLSALNNIMFFGRGHHVTDLKRKTEEILSFTDLTSRANDKVGTFSGGMKKRVSLCCALIHDPEILFLDEPTAAVDPGLKIQMWKLFRKLAQRGVTIIVSTHLMDETLLCDMVTILRNGEILAIDSPQQLIQKGKTSMKIISDGAESISVIDSTPESFANELKKFGLDHKVSSVELQADNIEDIILSIIEKKEGVKKS
jgi:ABC-2 type transport system ATP-binding protein